MYGILQLLSPFFMAEKRKFDHCVRHSAALSPFCMAEKKCNWGWFCLGSICLYLYACYHANTSLEICNGELFHVNQ